MYKNKKRWTTIYVGNVMQTDKTFSRFIKKCEIFI